MTTPDISSDPRSLAEERLFHLTRLGMRMQRRGGPDHGGWRDGRGGQGRVLALLAGNPEISQRELTYLLRLSRQALAQLLGKLEQRGLIERSQSGADRRMVIVTLTDAGRALSRPLRAISEQLTAIALSDLADDEKTTLMALLRRVRTTLDQ